jgi:hypothetical protein
MKNNQLEQLLTELTPQEAATVEGGAVFTLHSIDAINPTVQNDPRVRFGGTPMYLKSNMLAGDFATIEKDVLFDSPTPLRLFDWDFPNGLAGDDLLGEITINPENKINNGRFEAGGYALTYSVA